MIDEEVIRRCIDRDERGHRKLYTTCAPYVYSVVRSYISDASFHQDIIQETFANVFLKINTYNSAIGEFKPWLRKITVNNCLLHLRNDRKLKVIDSIDESDIDILPTTTEGYENISKQDIESLLASMPLGYKTVFMMIAIDGFNHEEVSQALNISNNASRSQYVRAKNYIQSKILNPENNSKYGIDN